MDEKEVCVIARIQAKKGRENALKKELAALIGPSRAEHGCITYVLHQAKDDAGSFMFYEHWTDKKELDEHLKKPYIQVFMEKAGAILDGPVSITLWEMIE